MKFSATHKNTFTIMILTNGCIFHRIRKQDTPDIITKRWTRKIFLNFIFHFSFVNNTFKKIMGRFFCVYLLQTVFLHNKREKW